MVSINPNFQGRVAGKPKTIATPQKEDAKPQVQTQQSQAPAQPETPVQPQQATLDNESLLAFKGIEIKKPEKVDEGVSINAHYRFDSLRDFAKMKKAGLFKSGDTVAIETADSYVRFIIKDNDELVLLEAYDK